MDLFGLLFVGLLIGMSHALEADHLAAIAALLDKKGSKRSFIARGIYWGLGHTFSLFIICSAVVILGITLSIRLQAGLELAVAIMIVALGLQVLWRMRRDKLHIHVHEHDGNKHLHVHSHMGKTSDHENHQHSHRPNRTNLKALCIGLVHGAAGSAALLVLLVTSTQSVGQSLLFFAVFGFGSIVGMAGLTAIAGFPLEIIEKSAAWLKPATSMVIGAVAIVVGSNLAFVSFAKFF